MTAPIDDTLLVMRAVDAGFDIGPDRDGPWLRFNAAGNLATIWLIRQDWASLVGVAPERLATEVGQLDGVTRWSGSTPPGAEASWHCDTDIALDRLLRRIAVLGHILPDQVLARFEPAVQQEIERVLASSEMERITEVRQRVGQDLYRAALMEYWHGRCALTAISEPSLLRASHAKPWRDATDRERLDVHNGLLLAAHLDIAFDRGFISVADDGTVLVSTQLPERERQVLGLDRPRRVDRLRPAHLPYLEWHRQHILIP